MAPFLFPHLPTFITPSPNSSEVPGPTWKTLQGERIYRVVRYKQALKGCTLLISWCCACVRRDCAMFIPLWWVYTYVCVLCACLVGLLNYFVPVCVCIFVWMCTCVCMFECLGAFVCLCMCVLVCLNVCVWMFMYVYVPCVCVCVCACMCVEFNRPYAAV